MLPKMTVVMVDYKSPNLTRVAIDSFKKFNNNFFDIDFLIVENSDQDIKSDFKEATVINRKTTSSFSIAHGEGLEAAKPYLTSEYVFMCHNDVCVTSTSFFEELIQCINEKVVLAGVCEDKHPDRVNALHCSGLFMSTELYMKIDMLPELPRIDTADKLTLHCREMGLKTKLFRNTYNDASFVKICNSPFKELGENCGVDRCLDSKGKVMYIHQGRGTTKNAKQYHHPGKMMTEEWIMFCRKLMNEI